MRFLCYEKKKKKTPYKLEKLKADFTLCRSGFSEEFRPVPPYPVQPFWESRGDDGVFSNTIPTNRFGKISFLCIQKKKKKWYIFFLSSEPNNNLQQSVDRMTGTSRDGGFPEVGIRFRYIRDANTSSTTSSARPGRAHIGISNISGRGRRYPQSYRVGSLPKSCRFVGTMQSAHMRVHV